MKHLAFAFLLATAAVSAFAQEKPVTISGYVFGDYYAVAAHHDPAIEGKNGFWIRRGYLTFDKSISDAFSARLRFEVNQPGDFKSSTTMEPYVKDAYLEWKRSPRMVIRAGMSATPTWEVIERIWGYRAIERTPLDLQRMGSPRDMGIAILGSIGEHYRYHVMAGNGSGTGSETNDEKKVAAAFGIAPTKATLIELYADRDSRPGDDDRSTLQAFAALQKEHMRAGVQFVHQMRDSGKDIDVASIFGVVDVRPNLTAVARVDRVFDPNPEADRIAYLPMVPTSRSTLLILGVDWKAHKNVSVIPNVEIVKYDEGFDADVLPRVTLFYTF